MGNEVVADVEQPKQTEPETPAEEPKRPVGEKAATVSPTDNGGQGEMFDDDFGGIAF